MAMDEEPGVTVCAAIIGLVLIILRVMGGKQLPKELLLRESESCQVQHPSRPPNAVFSRDQDSVMLPNKVQVGAIPRLPKGA